MVSAPLVPSVCNKIFLTERMKKFMPYASDELQYGEDFVLCMKYMNGVESVSLSNKPSYHYRFRKDSMVNEANDEYLHDLNFIWDELKDELSFVLKQQLMRKLVWLTTVMGEMMFGKKEYDAPKFFIRNKSYDGKKLAIYGAGICGRNYYSQLRAISIDVVAIFDRDNSKIDRVLVFPIDEWDVAKIPVALQTKALLDYKEYT